MLEAKRRAVRFLLGEKNPADGMIAYFAFYHPDQKTQIVTYPAGAERAQGFVTISRTGMDLFRPFVTLRFPKGDMDAGVALLDQAIVPGTAVILNSTPQDYPLVQALFDIHSEETLLVYELDQSLFEPIINVLVVRESSVNGLPRFVIRQTDGQTNHVMAASAGLNWMSPHFGEISVSTSPNYRRRGWGRSVVSSMVNYLLGNGRMPLYVVSQQNEASMQLAERVGFRYRGVQQMLVQATRRQT